MGVDFCFDHLIGFFLDSNPPCNFVKDHYRCAWKINSGPEVHFDNQCSTLNSLISKKDDAF